MSKFSWIKDFKDLLLNLFLLGVIFFITSWIFHDYGNEFLSDFFINLAASVFFSMFTIVVIDKYIKTIEEKKINSIKRTIRIDIVSLYQQMIQQVAIPLGFTGISYNSDQGFIDRKWTVEDVLETIKNTDLKKSFNSLHRLQM